MINAKNNLYKFFDKFGILVFLFLFADSLYKITQGKGEWDIYIILAIGLFGFLIDSYLVFFYKEDI